MPRKRAPLKKVYCIYHFAGALIAIRFNKNKWVFFANILPHFCLRLPEARYVGGQGDAEGREDVEEDPETVVLHAMVVVWEADGEKALDGHGHHHVDGGAERDPVERVLEPRKRPEQEVRVEGVEGVAERLQHPEQDVEAVADDQGWKIGKISRRSGVCSDSGKFLFFL